MKTKKILLVSPYFFPHKGGLEQFNLELATRMATDGYEITVLASRFGDEKAVESYRGLEICRLNNWNILGGTLPIPKNPWMVFTFIKKHKPDLIITSTRFFILNFYAALAARRYKIQRLHIEHGTAFVILKNPLFSYHARVYDKTFGHYVVSRAKVCFGISQKSAEFAQLLGAKKTAVLYNSVDCDFYNPKPHSQNTTINISYVGRLIYAKGVQDLVVAFKKIDNPSLRLLIAGEGNHHQELHNLAIGDKRIEFLGEISRDKVKDLLQKTDIFVNPSYGEGLPTTVLEAGAMECAVIATSVGGTGEIIKDGTNGFLIEPTDIDKLNLRLQELVSKPELRSKLANNLKSHILGVFCWDKNVERFEDELKNLK